MGWIERCYQTYEKNLNQVGKPSSSTRFEGEAPFLLPVAHTTQKVHVEVNLSASGDFLSARVLHPEEMTTIIPCTEASSSRTREMVPHPLVDKLQCVAGDYKAWGGDKDSKFTEYIANLQAWCDSSFGLDLVRTVLTYLKKGCLIQDLVSEGILYADENGHLLQKWNGPKEELPDIFRLFKDSKSNESQLDISVRFRVNGKDLSSAPEVWNSYTNYYLSTWKETGICYVQGQEMPLSRLSPQKIRSPGDRTKLISSNDHQNFTYRGRFRTASEAFSIGYETTQKAHSALRWLIGKQGEWSSNSQDEQKGKQKDGQVVLVWGTENEPVPPVTGDTCDLIVCSHSDLDDGEEEDDLDGLDDEKETLPKTRAAFAAQFNKAIKGYRHNLTPYSQISIIVLDSVTMGRLSIRYYRELQGSRLMDCIADWHKNFCWKQCYPKQISQKNGEKKSIAKFVGAPAPAEIAIAAYGANMSDKLKQQTIERLLPCITEGRRFPRDLMQAAAHRASNGIAVSFADAQKNRGIACALIRGYYHRNLKEEYTMALDETCSDRSYLFGRILACAERVEQNATYGRDEDAQKRPPNALRYEVAFTQHPAKTLALLRKQLEPYLERLIKENKSTYANDLMLQLISRIPMEQFNEQPLTELYLLGYACQREEFFKKKAAKNAEAAATEKGEENHGSFTE